MENGQQQKGRQIQLTALEIKLTKPKLLDQFQ
jgi:hypothetical protein